MLINPATALAAKEKSKPSHIDRRGMVWTIAGGTTACISGYYPCYAKRSAYSSITTPLAGTSAAVGFRPNPFVAVLATYDFLSLGVSKGDGKAYANYAHFHSATANLRVMFPFGISELGAEGGLGWGHWSYGVGTGETTNGMGFVGRLSPTLDFHVRPRLFVGFGLGLFLNGFERRSCKEQIPREENCPQVVDSDSTEAKTDYTKFKQGLPHRNAIMIGLRVGGTLF
ncbi:hypothetical protein [Paraliomyxa miuraensis]|uniref:hypothetical protein n=1 Tax=Paraliomyxa miuraensis TaxID=376150 RepID=UPI00224FF735|nr:hypothetical protein [Paraliomyxa miuraensis]MCX4239415.1 hypothetical protein [Paraliomyxa miuraensis]